MPEKGKTHHVVHNPNGGWDVKRGGGERASSHHNTQKEAIQEGRQVSRNQGTELKIHGENGRIRESDSHVRDPYPPKG